MRLEKAHESWLIDLRSRNTAKRTQETYSLAVVQLLDWLKQQDHSLDVTEVNPTDIREFIGWMLDNRSPATAQQRYRSLSVLFKWLVAEGEIETDPMAKVTKPQVEPPMIEVISEPVFNRLCEVCAGDFLGRRDEAIMRLLWDTGMRISELTGLRVEDVSLGMEMVWVDGKTGPRSSPFTPAAKT